MNFSFFVVTENHTNGYVDYIIDSFFFFSIFATICVIINKNPIVSVLFLIFLFIIIASYLITLGLSYIGLSYLLVYVGAVSILFLFILMLINVRISELLSNTGNSILLAIVIAICFIYTVNQVLPDSLAAYSNYIDYLSSLFYGVRFSVEYINYVFKILNINNYTSPSLVTSNIWDGSLGETTHITAIGNIMYTGYSIWLIEVSVLLLVAMVGSILITIKKSEMELKSSGTELDISGVIYGMNMDTAFRRRDSHT